MSSAADGAMSSGSAILRSRLLLCSGIDRELAIDVVARRHTAVDMNFILMEKRLKLIVEQPG